MEESPQDAPPENVHVIIPEWSYLYDATQCRVCRRWIYKDSDGVWQHSGGRQ